MDTDQVENALDRNDTRDRRIDNDIHKQRCPNDDREQQLCIGQHQFFRGNAQRQEKRQPLLLDFISRKVQNHQQCAPQKDPEYRKDADKESALCALGVALAEQVVVICAQNPISACGNGCNGTPQREVIVGSQLYIQAAVSFFSIW